MQTISIQQRRQDFLLLVFSIAGFTALSVLGIFLTGSKLSLISPTSTSDLISRLFAAISIFFCAALLLPLIIYCIRKLRGLEIPPARVPPIKIWQVVAIFATWLASVILGSLLNTLPQFGELIALPFLLLEIALPIAGLIWIAIGGLPSGSKRRSWAAFSIGMIGSTLGALLLEYGFVGIAILVARLIATTNPAWFTIFQQIQNQLTNTGDIQTLLTKLAPYLANPVALILALLFASLLAPLIEETLKPAAIWLLGKRLQSPSEGFALGALCGAGFALLEGTLMIGGSTQMLGFGLAARATSSLMHITATGMMGWGIAYARLEKRYGRLVGAYLLSIGIHGLWNGSVVLAVFGSLRLALPGAGSDPLGVLLVILGVLILVFMLIMIMILLPTINHRLRPVLHPADKSTQSDIIAPLKP